MSVTTYLGMTKYAVYANPNGEIEVKVKADLLEAYLGALYVETDLEWCSFTVATSPDSSSSS